jgi:hypothetical protein
MTRMAGEKVADRPHRLTLFLSALALVVSAISLVASLESVRVNKATSRAVLHAAAVTLPRNPAEMSFVQIDLTLTNHGKATAREVETSFEWDVTTIPVAVREPNYAQPRHADFAPGVSQTIRMQANRRFTAGQQLGRRGIRNEPHQLLITGTTAYTDDLTGDRHRTLWCFQYDPLDPVQAASREMRPCLYQRH